MMKGIGINQAPLKYIVFSCILSLATNSSANFSMLTRHVSEGLPITSPSWNLLKKAHFQNLEQFTCLEYRDYISHIDHDLPIVFDTGASK